jgi:cytochrome b561
MEIAMSAAASTPAPRNWDAGLKALHWSMAVLIPLAWVLAVLREDQPRETAAKLMMAHKSIGLLVFALLLVRILWRLTHAAPEAEKTPWEPLGGLAAKAGHGVLYLLMIAVPLGGIAATLVNGRTLPFFGLFEIASPFAQNHDLAEAIGGVHELFGHALLMIALAHALVGILHHAVLKDRTLLKMKPFARD